VEFGRILRLVELSGFFRYRIDISRNLRLVDLSGNLRLVDLGGNLRLVDLSRFSRF
jgi:hypothetical protein